MKLLKHFFITIFFLINLSTAFGQNAIVDSNASISDVSDTLLRNNPDSLSNEKNIGDSLISKDAIKSVINYSANDSFPIYMENNIMTLYKNAVITYEDIKVEAGIIKIDWNKNLIYAYGYYDSLEKYQEAPVFTESGKAYKAKKIIYNFKSKKAKIFSLYTEEDQSYIHGKEVKKDENNVLCIKNAKYTTCNLEHPHFYIAATKIKILENQIITGPAYFVIEDIPLPIGIPFGFFPKKQTRSSGIILPSYGESNNRGFYLRGLGYYFGINDYFDLLLKGDIYSRGSWMMDLSSNYSKRYNYRGNFGIKYGYNKYGDPDASDFRLDKDFSVRWTHRQDPKARPNSNFSANVNAGSQNSFRNNSMNANEILQNNLSSNVTYSKTFAGTPFSMNASASHSQNLSNNTVSLTAPNLSLNMKRIFPFRGKGVKKNKWYNDIGLSYNMDFRNNINTIDSILFTEATWREWQNGIKHNIPFSTSFKILKYFSISPSVNYTGRTYFEKIHKTYYSAHDSAVADTVITKTLHGVYHLHDVSVSGNISTRIYGMYNINKFGLIAIRHLVSPNVSFSYHPDFSNPDWGYYQEVQTDTTGNNFEKYNAFQGAIFGSPSPYKQGNLNFRIQNNFEAKIKTKTDTATKENTKKIKLLDNLNFSGYYNFLADSMKLSDIRFNGRTSLFKNKISIQFSGTIDPYHITKDSFRIDKLAIFNGFKAGRLTRGNISVNARINSPKNKDNSEQIGFNGMPYGNYVDFDIPWNISFNYSLNYSNYRVSSGKVTNAPEINQTLTFSGNLSLTKKWKINFRSGYDLELNKFSFTSFDIYRDLHCWEMSFSWIPFGYRQSYMFKINVKSAILKDLKFDKKKYYYDY